MPLACTHRPRPGALLGQMQQHARPPAPVPHAMGQCSSASPEVLLSSGRRDTSAGWVAGPHPPALSATTLTDLLAQRS